MIRQDFDIYFSFLKSWEVGKFSVHVSIICLYAMLFKKILAINYSVYMTFLELIKFALVLWLIPHLAQIFPWWENVHQSPEDASKQALVLVHKGSGNEDNYLDALVVMFFLTAGIIAESVFNMGDKTEFNHAENSDSKVNLNEEPPLDWFWHACLYGHKRQLRKICDKHIEQIDINESKFKGNAAIHLAIWSGHVDTVRALLSRFAPDLDWSKRNDYGHNPLDLALMKKNEVIIKIVLKHASLEMSSLMFAMLNRQHHHVSTFLKQLKGDIIEKDRFLPVFIQRFIEISRELELKKTSKERREVCNRNLNIIEKTCCGKILILFYPNCKTVLDIHQKVELESLVQEESKESDDQDSREENTSKVPGIDEVFEEFSCPICCFLMQPPERRIYGCSNDHWICSTCLVDPKIKSCPSCREDFNVNAPKIRTTSERCLSLLLEKFNYNDDE